MVTILLPPDFKEFLKLLNSHEVEYLVIGGYAVNFHGYPRATGDIDIWVSLSSANAERVASAVRDFGFAGATPDQFTEPGKVIRMGIPPLRVEVLTSISGLQFHDCFQNRVVADLDGVAVPFIGIDALRANKKASGRLKDLADLEELS